MSVFISFEGVDGAGKSTQLKLLLEYLDEKGIPYVFTREPGGTLIAERIRELLLDPANAGMSVITEALLFAASRAEHVSQVIRPALLAGKVVVCDRYIDSSLVYQGAAGGLSADFINRINEVATGALRPDRTILLDLSTEVAAARKTANAEADRMEQKEMAFHRQVRQAYRNLAEDEPLRVKLVDASGSVQDVQAQIRRLVDEVLSRAGRG